MKTTKTTHNGLSLLGNSQARYPEHPDDAELETFANLYHKRDYEITFQCPEFTALCPVTGQPDFGNIIIRYIPDEKCIESKSLKLYLFSFRSYNTFHEESVNRILDDIVKFCKPRRAIVEGVFRARGGISISVSATYDRDK